MRVIRLDERPCSSHLRTLEGIKDELQILSERSSAVGYKENEADGRAISELAEDLRDAIIEYQVGPAPRSPQGPLLRHCAVHSTEVNVRTKL